MTRHSRDQFFVVGEGVLSPDSPGAARQATPQEQSRAFRFSRLGPKGPRLDTALLEAVAVAMTTTAPGTSDPDGVGVPAGYTYLGQFVDHDMTKDVTDAALGEDVTLAELLQGRSPALDLDSLYGRGPRDLQARQFYADDARLRMGTTAGVGFPPGDAGAGADHPGFDLPRVGVDPTRPQTKADQRAPLVPDHRNDENLPVAQTHLAFLRFHNRVVDQLVATGLTERQAFPKARDTVVRHYQWMLRTDFLPRLVDPAVVDDVFTHGRRFVDPGPHPRHDAPTMPLEFSVAAYRLGHSMVRDRYQWNRVFSSGGPAGPATLLQLFTFTGVNGIFSPVAAATDLDDPDAGTALRLPSNWLVDFRRLYDFTEAGRADLVPPEGAPNPAKRIDTRLVDPLAGLPLGAFGGRPPAPPATSVQRNLAFRNLVRARMVELASGQQMAALMGVAPLTAEQVLHGGDGGADLSGLTAAQQAALVAATPLWLYVLREAELGDGRLTGVGGRLVAEVFSRAMEGSSPSIVRSPHWRPSLGPDSSTFRMVDLLLFAADGRADVLNPLGDAAPAPLPAPVPAQPGPAVTQPAPTG